MADGQDASPSGGEEKVRWLRVRRVDQPPYAVEPGYRRLREKDTLIRRVDWDKTSPLFGYHPHETLHRVLDRGGPGYTRADHALFRASRAAYDALMRAGAFSEHLDRGPRSKYAEGLPPVGLPLAQTSLQVKRAATFLGAGRVGIARVDRRWLYAPNDGEAERVPEQLKFAVVMAFPMDAQGIATSPALPSAAATGLGYSRMTLTTVSVAEFIRDLGYRALPSGNDSGLNIPLAIDAGLGELGRHGLLLTPKWGPRVRLGKVFTDLSLEPDRPVSFGATKFCASCRRCATACEAGAIPMDVKPSFGPSPTSNPGVLKWHVDAEKCYGFWLENGMDCSNCITTCPYSASPVHQKPEEFWGSNVKPE